MDVERAKSLIMRQWLANFPPLGCCSIPLGLGLSALRPIYCTTQLRNYDDIDGVSRLRVEAQSMSGCGS